MVDALGFIPMDFHQDWSYTRENNTVMFGIINEFAWIALDACEVSKYLLIDINHLYGCISL